MVSLPSGPVKSNTSTNQSYGKSDAELYMVDLGDGYLARIVYVYGTNAVNYDSPTNGYRILTIRMSDGVVVAESLSKVVPLVFNGKAFLIVPGTTVLNLVKQTYSGSGVWLSASVPTQTTDLTFRYPYIRFQLITPTKLVLSNLTPAQMIEIPNLDITLSTTVAAPINGSDFQEFTDAEVISVNTYSQGSNVSIDYYNANTYVRMPGAGSFQLNKANILQQSYMKDGPGSSSNLYYFVQVYTNLYTGYAYRDNLEFSTTFFDHSGNPGQGVNVYSVQPGYNPMSYSESAPQTLRRSYFSSNFAHKDNKFYIGVGYASAESKHCIGIAVLDVSTPTGVVVYAVALPDDTDNYTPVSTFVDALGNAYARIQTNTAGSFLIKLDSNNVLSRLNITVNDILPVGTDTFYTFREDTATLASIGCPQAPVAFIPFTTNNGSKLDYSWHYDGTLNSNHVFRFEKLSGLTSNGRTRGYDFWWYSGPVPVNGGTSFIGSGYDSVGYDASGSKLWEAPANVNGYLPIITENWMLYPTTAATIENGKLKWLVQIDKATGTLTYVDIPAPQLFIDDTTKLNELAYKADQLILKPDGLSFYCYTGNTDGTYSFTLTPDGLSGVFDGFVPGLVVDFTGISAQFNWKPIPGKNEMYYSGYNHICRIDCTTNTVLWSVDTRSRGISEEIFVINHKNNNIIKPAYPPEFVTDPDVTTSMWFAEWSYETGEFVKYYVAKGLKKTNTVLSTINVPSWTGPTVENLILTRNCQMYFGMDTGEVVAFDLVNERVSGKAQLSPNYNPTQYQLAHYYPAYPFRAAEYYASSIMTAENVWFTTCTDHSDFSSGGTTVINPGNVPIQSTLFSFDGQSLQLYPTPLDVAPELKLYAGTSTFSVVGNSIYYGSYYGISRLVLGEAPTYTTTRTGQDRIGVSYNFYLDGVSVVGSGTQADPIRATATPAVFPFDPAKIITISRDFLSDPVWFDGTTIGIVQRALTSTLNLAVVNPTSLTSEIPPSTAPFFAAMRTVQYDMYNVSNGATVPGPAKLSVPNDSHGPDTPLYWYTA